jgi:hypothetical protein
MYNQKLVAPSLQCASSPFGLAKDFLPASKVTTLELSPYSSDLVAADFYLFP